jgi:hypothetical protein
VITKEQIQVVVRCIVEGYASDRIILSGAYAYDEPIAHSDRDLLVIKEKAEGKRAERATAVWQHLWNNDFPAMGTLSHTPAKMEKAASTFQSAETIAETRGRVLYAAWHARAKAQTAIVSFNAAEMDNAAVLQDFAVEFH